MARQEYERELDALRGEVLHMGEVVSTRLRKVLTALDRNDLALAARIQEADGEINQLYLDLERDCIDLIALQQPVASDLRFVAASFKIITDLERIADLAANLAAYVHSSTRELFAELDVGDLGQVAVEMLQDALSAYETEDAAACFDVAARDDDLDGRCERVAQRAIRDLAERTPETEALEPLLEDVYRLLLTVRDVERIGDHAVNTAARTLYMIESDDALIY